MVYPKSSVHHIAKISAFLNTLPTIFEYRINVLATLSTFKLFSKRHVLIFHTQYCVLRNDFQGTNTYMFGVIRIQYLGFENQGANFEKKVIEIIFFYFLTILWKTMKQVSNIPMLKNTFSIQKNSNFNPILHGLLEIHYHMGGIKTIPPY